MNRSDFYKTDGYCLIGASLKNIGNTCFLNAVLQCLTHTVPLVEALWSSDHYSSCPCDGHDFCSLCALKQHVDYCLQASGFPITPKYFVDNLSNFISIKFIEGAEFLNSQLQEIMPDFLPGQEQDGHEFLCCLLDRLHECHIGKPSSFEENSLIKQIFGGRLRSQMRCCNCGNVTNTYEPLIDLSLEIDNAETLSLAGALESFTRVERIDDPENKLLCEGCKEQVSVEKQIKLVEIPQVIMVNFKRFKVYPYGIYKIGKFVEYPLQMDFRPFLGCSLDEAQYNYELYAVLVHANVHYYSIVRSMQNVWHMINDDKVFRIPEDLVLNRPAYIVFYIKQGSSPWFASVMERFHSNLRRKLARGITAVETLEEKNDTTLVSSKGTSQASEDETNEGENPSKAMEQVTQNDGRTQCDNGDVLVQDPEAIDQSMHKEGPH